MNTAERHLIKLVISKHTFVFIPGRSHTNVNIVERHLMQLVIYGHMSVFTPERSHSNVSTVERDLMKLVIYGHMSVFTPEISHSNVNIVERHSVTMVIYTNTSTSIQETNSNIFSWILAHVIIFGKDIKQPNNTVLTVIHPHFHKTLYTLPIYNIDQRNTMQILCSLSIHRHLQKEMLGGSVLMLLFLWFAVCSNIHCPLPCLKRSSQLAQQHSFTPTVLLQW